MTIRAQRAHFTHASSKPMEFALVAVERGKREREGGKKKDFDFIWQPETPSHSLYQKGREAWSVHCHKINTDTKSKETEIKRVIDGERGKVKTTGRERKSGGGERSPCKEGEEEMCAEGGEMRDGAALHTAGIISRWD